MDTIKHFVANKDEINFAVEKMGNKLNEVSGSEKLNIIKDCINGRPEIKSYSKIGKEFARILVKRIVEKRKNNNEV